jgi:transposase
MRFGGLSPTRIAVEAGTHSPWVSRLLKECGHEVLVANPRKLRLVYENDRKDDEVDAEYLARLARLDPELLSPIQHRSAAVQQDLAVLRARDVLVRTRTKLVNHVRGSVKAVGQRLAGMSTETFGSRALAAIPPELRPALEPVIVAIRTLTEQIRRHDSWVEQEAQVRYPQSAVLRQVPGVGPLTSVAYVLTLEDPKRFAESRMVGAYLGLSPKRAQSGQTDPQLRISKAGDGFLRRLLVGSAHYILGPFGPDSDLRRWGKSIAERGGKTAKKRAVVAVARKLAVLLHRLWVTQEAYEPLRPRKGKLKAPDAKVLVPPPPDSPRSSEGEGGGTKRDA